MKIRLIRHLFHGKCLAVYSKVRMWTAAFSSRFTDAFAETTTPFAEKPRSIDELRKTDDGINGTTPDVHVSKASSEEAKLQ